MRSVSKQRLLNNNKTLIKCFEILTKILSTEETEKENRQQQLIAKQTYLYIDLLTLLNYTRNIILYIKPFK